jgi:tetratricopeptide (TPR) repeat protein
MKQISILILFSFSLHALNSQSNNLPPESIGYRLTKATEQARLKNYTEAILIVDSAMSIDSSNEHIYALKSELLWLSKDYYASAICFQKAMTLNRDSSYLKGADLFLGVLYEKAGFRDEAQKHYLKAIDLFENFERIDDRFFETSNGIDYAVALILSGKKKDWTGLMSSNKFDRYKDLYKGKTRAEVFETYWKEYDAD